MRSSNSLNILVTIFIIFIMVCIYLHIPHVNEVDFFHKNGYLVIPNVLTNNEIGEFDKLIHKEISKLKSKKQYGDINLNRERKFDLNLDIEEPTKSIVRRVIYERLRPLVNSYGKDPIILDYSVLLNAPFSDPQVWHRDVVNNGIHNNGNYIFVGVAVSDITDDMGGLEVVPESQQIMFNEHIGQIQCHHHFKNVCGHFNNNDFKYKRIACPKGSLVLWNSKVIHRSGMNMSRNMRKMFYFSLLFKTHDKPEGGTNSLKDIYKKRHPLYMETL